MIDSVRNIANQKLENVGGCINLVVCDDSFIHDLNKQYLAHDYPTDVITFVLEAHPLDAEIYISYETAAEQAKDYQVSLTQEMCRLAVHGALHIAGYDDDSDEKRQAMHKLENHYLKLTGFTNV
jgi:probable rRNA maturation factor